MGELANRTIEKIVDALLDICKETVSEVFDKKDTEGPKLIKDHNIKVTVKLKK